MQSPQPLFLSHSSSDDLAAKTILSRLESEGVPCWYAPRDIQPGTLFATALYEALENCGAVLVLVSRNSDKSNHIARELTVADQFKKPIIPVMLEHYFPTGALCYFARAANSINWFSEQEKSIQEIVEFHCCPVKPPAPRRIASIGAA
jgi:TIR domain